jgi:hypothetical protein
MKSFLLTLLLLVLLGEVSILYFMHRGESQNKVLAEATQAPASLTLVSSPEPTAEAATPTPLATPTPKPKPKPTKTPIPQPKFSSQEINGFIDRFAGQYGVSPDVLRYMALCESGFNPAAYHAGYAGLFQFAPITWKNLRLKIGENPDIDLRFNAEEAAQTAAYAISQGKRALWPNCYP